MAVTYSATVDARVTVTIKDEGVPDFVDAIYFPDLTLGNLTKAQFIQQVRPTAIARYQAWRTELAKPQVRPSKAERLAAIQAQEDQLAEQRAAIQAEA